MENRTAVPTLFWIISGLGLLWNLMGCFTWFTEYSYWTKPETRSALDPAFDALYEATPAWLYIIFAIAVITGTLGCIGLLMRKRWASTMFLVSLVAVIIQFGYNLFGTELLSALGNSAAIMPIVVVLVAALLYFYSKRSYARSWLN